MTRRAKAEHASGHTVLLVDDNPDYLQATRLLLEREGHNVLTATNGAEALGILPQQKVDLLLLDYFMPGMTGEQVVAELRKFDPFVQVILQTGYASEQPPRELLQRLNIQGYYDKTEGPEQLLLWTTVGLKAADTVQLLFKTRHGVKFILDSTPELHRIQPAHELMREVLAQVRSLVVTLGASEDIGGFLATLDARFDLVIRAGTEAYAAAAKARDVLDDGKASAMEHALQDARVQIGQDGTILPLRVGPLTLGVIYLDQPVLGDQALELLRMLSNQAAAALQNAQLLELASFDVLTGVYARGFFEQALTRELAASFRARQGIALLLIDVDDMKGVNQRAGHVAGDQALAALAKVLRRATRVADIVGRYEGDAFAVVLRDSEVVGPSRLSSRVFDLLRDQVASGPEGEAPLRVSVGFSILEPEAPGSDGAKLVSLSYFQAVAELLRASALGALEEARQGGGSSVRGAAPVRWPSP